MNLLTSSMLPNFQRLALCNKDMFKTNETSENQEVQTSGVNNDNQVTSQIQLENQPEQDSFVRNDDNLAADAFKGASILALASFCFGFAPELLLLATGAFLFSNKGEDFKTKIGNEIKKDLSAYGKYTQMQAMQTMQAQQAQQVNPAQENNQNNQYVDVEANEVENNNTTTNPIQNTQQSQDIQQERPLTPYEKAEQRYSKAQDYHAKATENLQRKEMAQQVAEQKLNTAQAELDKAQLEYDNARAEVKTQMTARMSKLQNNVNIKKSNLEVATQKANLARTLLQEADMKLAKAQENFERFHAETVEE